MATLTTNTPNTSALQTLRLKIAALWAHRKTRGPKDPRIAQSLRKAARNDVDRLLRQHH